MDLLNPVTAVPLIGPKNEKLLEKLSIKTVGDLINHYPFRYDDYSIVRKISALRVDEIATVIAIVEDIKLIFTKSGKRMVKATVTDETGSLAVTWFNQPYLIRTIKKGDKLSLSGKLGFFDRHRAFISPEYELVRSENTIHTGRLVPIYPETNGVSSKWLRSRINALLKILPEIEDYLPREIKRENNFCELDYAISAIHFPKNDREVMVAKKRLSFDELFLMQLKAFLRKAEWENKKESVAINVSIHRDKIDSFIKGLPFKLTNAQKRCVNEILDDLETNKPMNRLLEGDVGSGKTVVAAIAIYVSHLSKAKSLYMAPTEILANQQYLSLKKYLEPYGIKVTLITGSKKDKEEGDVTVGTHALLFKRENFDNLGLIVIDEQHRFGVGQRAELTQKTTAENAPNILTMTATPIPRSLTLTICGDLSLSIIDEMPKGRKPVKTWFVPKEKKKSSYEWIRKRIREGEQAFIICPFIEESEIETLKSVKAVKVEFEKLSKEIFPDLTLGLLHGKMKSKEKDVVITDFKNKKYHILVSTPVVEVGIDISNATIMVIEGAERFGLASLHQLRGRVGRGEKQSYCLLFTDIYQGIIAERMRAMEKYQEGIKLAEIDMQIRGPGDIYGEEQHGFMKLKIASLYNTEMVKLTRENAEEYFAKLDDYPLLKSKITEQSKNVKPN
ncbi:ATP-dependent DNA helicase RecG [candidate division WWE3 bacterium CG08_land_8_20_14_0_20_41_15]|uniref:ATP-dependent DNA helicase RecG n=1 Tax=candidate division WWE3 bacterium CG08_land_8_20_14_0_20_41_15 TaxID=1975086 RepID=A0A2H0X947_UNCKA|nr:MAG: ATP-dependent DNA helicase RecG [candidate division WWE3 bacterium CG08_land_8_20_14_0_20_41_15]